MHLNLKVTRNRANITGVIERAKNLAPGFKRAAMVFLSVVQQRIRTKNDGTWPSGVEQLRGTLLFRTGALMRSLTLGGEGNQYEEITEGVRIGTNLRTPDERFNIGKLMQFGTGIYGASGSPIKPKKPGGALRFSLNGKKVYAKSVKGSPKRPFLFFDTPTSTKVGNALMGWILEGGP